MVYFQCNISLRDFFSYCKKATAKLLGDIIHPDHIESKEIQDCLEQWNEVVIFYSFRLFFAPLIESIILYDRLLSLMEKSITMLKKYFHNSILLLGSLATLIPAFENRISPRMHVLQGYKVD